MLTPQERGTLVSALNARPDPADVAGRLQNIPLDQLQVPGKGLADLRVIVANIGPGADQFIKICIHTDPNDNVTEIFCQGSQAIADIFNQTVGWTSFAQDPNTGL